MENETKDKLKNIFDKYDKKQSEVRQEAEKVKTEHEVFLDAFEATSTEVIRPTMEALGEIIKNRGHGFEITQGKESQDDKGRTVAAQVKMQIHPNGKRPSYGQHDCPSLTFFAGTYKNEVWSHVSTMMPGRGGSAGKRNEYKLENITSEVVEKEIIHLLNECFGK